ncbi:unnamed protein product [Oikopleura dioica]|uniref:Tubulin polymerization-promoting protein family member 3 n=1 Tax=Oikopleura dioica TaxID=34765 RepID=E4XY40_OIKDI|nr:unnamed protein product [Oikopleura dioica]
MSASVKSTFQAFAVQGTTATQAKSTNEINNKNFSKLCKDCKVIGQKCTSTDVDIVFSKCKTKGAQKMTFEQFCQALKELSPKRFPKKSKDEAEEAIFKLVEDKTPGTNATTKTTNTKNVDRMTDASKYTGAHKSRFDAETGKGKGIDGRKDVDENTGYVGAYKGDGTYDKTH